MVSTFEDIHARKVLALRAVLAGSLVQMGIEFLMARYFPLVPYWAPLSWWGTGFEVIIASVFALFLGMVGGWTIVRLYHGRRAILLFYILIMQALGALTTAISGISLAFYLAANVSLILGILTGGLWIHRPVRAAW